MEKWDSSLVKILPWKLCRMTVEHKLDDTPWRIPIKAVLSKRKNWCSWGAVCMYKIWGASTEWDWERRLFYLWSKPSIFLAFLSKEMKCFFFFFKFIFISWRLITLQYCSGFCHTLTWISHGFTCVPHPEPCSRLPPHPIPLGQPSAPAPSTCLMHPTWAGDLFHIW